MINKCLRAIFLSIFLAAQACATIDSIVGENISNNSKLDSIAVPTLGNQSDQEIVEEFYAINPLYRPFAVAITAASLTPSSFSVRSQEFLYRAKKQDIFPQITPGTSIDDDGNITSRLALKQTLYDNGRYKASRNVLATDIDIARAELSIEANDRIAAGFDAYLRLQRLGRHIEATELLLSKYKALYQMAVNRVEGGIGKQAEKTLYQLKELQAANELADYRSEYRKTEEELILISGGNNPSTLPQRLTFPEAIPQYVAKMLAMAPSVNLASAQSYKKEAELKKAKTERLPILSLQGSVGSGNESGQGFSDRLNNATVGLTYTRSIYWGRNLELESLSQEVLGAKARLRQTRRDVKIESTLYLNDIVDLEKQMLAKRNLVKLAEQRTSDFRAQFQAGSVTMSEAVSMLETLKTIQRQLIEVEYRLVASEVQIAALLGILGPVSDNRSEFLR